MNTELAFMMGMMNRGNERRVFDWDKAACIILEKKPKVAFAGLAGDLEWTGGDIYADGKAVDEYTYLASTWATPILILTYDDDRTETFECWRMISQTPGWDSDTKWPQSALDILGITFDEDEEEE